MSSVCLLYLQTAISIVVGLNALQMNGKEALEGTDVIRLPDMTNANTLAVFPSSMAIHLTVSYKHNH
jgi:hypothetical protein